jgi:NTE family protein
MYSFAEALTFGQPNFFRPNFPNPYFASPGTPAATAFYDTSPLQATLQRLASFDLINERKTRLSLGATSVTTGHMVFFDNTRQTIGPEHVMASGSLPPGFPAVAIEGDLYWDGGCISNTPLEAVLADMPNEDTIVFMIDLWSASGKPPQTLDDVLWRQKQIQYASRTSHHIDAVATKLNLRRAQELLEAEVSAPSSHAAAAKPINDAKFDIVHIVYHPEADQIPQSDAEFSRISIVERREAGYRDMRQALEKIPWFEAAQPAQCCAVHKVEQGAVTVQSAGSSLQATGEVTSRFAAE